MPHNRRPGEPATVEDRLAELERKSHEPFDFTALLGRVETLETATSVAFATPAELHRAHEAQYQYAKLAWEKIKDNLRDRSILDFEDIPELMREVDEEQIEVIRMHMGGTSVVEFSRDMIHIEYRRKDIDSPVAVAPLGSVTSRVRQAIDAAGHAPVSFRTSKETIEKLRYDGGVISDEMFPGRDIPAAIFMGLRIRAWGDFS